MCRLYLKPIISAMCIQRNQCPCRCLMRQTSSVVKLRGRDADTDTARWFGYAMPTVMSAQAIKVMSLE